MLLLPVISNAFSGKVEINGIWYNVVTKGKKAEVTYGNTWAPSSYRDGDGRYSGDIVIPSTIEYEGVTCNVTSIDYYTFKLCKVTSVTIPNSVTSIGEEAFKSCSSLKTVTIGNGVTSIGKDAFWACSGLESVYISDLAAWCKINFKDTSNPLYCAHRLFLNGEQVKDLVIPDGVESIGSEVFYRYSGLTSITIPPSVTSIGYNAFTGSNAPIYVSDLDTWLKIEKNGNPFGYYHLFINGKELKELVIPDGTNFINNDAFNGCKSLNSLIIPNSVKTIGEYAFRDCSALTFVSIGDSVNSICHQAFANCSALTSVIIPNNVTTIGNYAFQNCGALTTVTIGNSVNSLGGGAFADCPSLENVFCYAEELPTLVSLDVFTGSYINYATLHIPLSFVDKYKEAEPWNKFGTIMAICNLIYMVDGELYKSYEKDEGTTIKPEAEPIKEGYTFSGWSEIPQIMPNHDVTVTGSFTINKYKLIYKVDGEVYKSYEIEYGSTFTPEAEPTKEGYTFSGWSSIPETMPANDVTVTGSFSVNKYKLIYMVDGEVYKTFEVEYGATITPEPAPNKEGYDFSGWDNVPETMPAHDVTVNGSLTVGINDILINSEEVKIFDMKGNQIGKLQKGINILVYKDGKTKKVVMK